MEEKIKDLLEKIKRTAEIILEHHPSRAFKDDIITLGAESIIAMCKDAISEIEKEKKEGSKDL
jgi:sugar-specific transcriptional regulator TrmB